MRYKKKKKILEHGKMSTKGNVCIKGQHKMHCLLFFCAQVWYVQLCTCIQLWVQNTKVCGYGILVISLQRTKEPLCNNRLLPNIKHCRLLFLLCTCLWLKYNCNFSFRYANVKGRGSINWSEVRKVLLSQNAII